MRMTFAFVLSAVLLLAGCVSLKTWPVRDPVTGRVESCSGNMSVLTMAMDGRCTDGTSVETRIRDGKSSVVAKDRSGNVVTCGPNFNGAVCWPSANALRPARCEDDNLVSKGDWCVEKK